MAKKSFLCFGPTSFSKLCENRRVINALNEQLDLSFERSLTESKDRKLTISERKEIVETNIQDYYLDLLLKDF